MTSHFVTRVQRLILVISYFLHGLEPWRSRRARISWVVGPDECASMVLQIAAAIPGSYSVSFVEEVAYSGRGYDLRLRSKPGTSWRWRERVLVGPAVLGKLMRQADGFIYVGASGFLLDDLDQREFEFSFLKRHSLPIVCYWCGSDIRSTKRMHHLEAETGLPNISTYIGLTDAGFESEHFDELRKRVAAVADRHANAMFSNTVDHLGYLTTATEPFLYFLGEESFPTNSRFDDVSRPVVVHATSSPIIKGTQLVRAAIAKLRTEGYDFEYSELIGVPNATVRSELARAHIALNQFYGFSPAVFGAEALAAGCVVMMSSDETIESDLPAGSNEAWVVTKHYNVYERLKSLLDEPQRLAQIAQRGQEWARAHASRAGAGATLQKVLDAVLDGTYQPPGDPHG